MQIHLIILFNRCNWQIISDMFLVRTIEYLVTV